MYNFFLRALTLANRFNASARIANFPSPSFSVATNDKYLRGSYARHYFSGSFRQTRCSVIIFDSTVHDNSFSGRLESRSVVAVMRWRLLRAPSVTHCVVYYYCILIYLLWPFSTKEVVLPRDPRTPPPGHCSVLRPTTATPSNIEHITVGPTDGVPKTEKSMRYDSLPTSCRIR